MTRRTLANTGLSETVVTLAKAGVCATRLAAYVSMTPSGIRGYLKRRDLYQSPQVTPETLARLEALYLEGLSVEEIAEDIGYSHGCVRWWLKRRDMWLPERTHVTEEMEERMVRYRERGVLMRVIANRLGVSESAVQFHLARRLGKQWVPLSPEERERIATLYQKEFNMAQIGRRVRRDPKTVSQVLKGLGLHDAERARRAQLRRPGVQHSWRAALYPNSQHRKVKNES